MISNFLYYYDSILTERALQDRVLNENSKIRTKCRGRETDRLIYNCNYRHLLLQVKNNSGRLHEGLGTLVVSKEGRQR